MTTPRVIEHPVGWCARCGEPVHLHIQGCHREARCACERPAIPAAFFQLAERNPRTDP